LGKASANSLIENRVVRQKFLQIGFLEQILGKIAGKILQNQVQITALCILLP
jgi:hypothetical protein